MAGIFENNEEFKQEYDAYAKKSAETGGRKLAMPGEVKAEAEALFGYDFSDVVLREKAEVAELGDEAYAVGNEIHFAPGLFRPDTPNGKALLVHELAHVVQHAQGRVGAGTGFASDLDAGLEAEADRMSAKGTAAGELAVPGPRVASGGNLKGLSAGAGQRLLAKGAMAGVKKFFLRLVNKWSNRKRDMGLESRTAFRESRKLYRETIRKSDAHARHGKGHDFKKMAKGSEAYVPELDINRFMLDSMKEEIRTDPELIRLSANIPEEKSECGQRFFQAVKALDMYTDIPNIVNTETVKMEVSALNAFRRRCQRYHIAYEKLREEWEASDQQDKEKKRIVRLEEKRDEYLARTWAKLETRLSGSLDLAVNAEAEVEEEERGEGAGLKKAGAFMEFELSGIQGDDGIAVTKKDVLSETCNADTMDKEFLGLVAWVQAYQSSNQPYETSGRLLKQLAEDYIKNAKSIRDAYGEGTRERVILEQRCGYAEEVFYALQGSAAESKLMLQEAVESGPTYINRDADQESSDRSNLRHTPLFQHTPCINDIRQNSIRDCFLLSALMALISSNPDYIYSMFSDLGNGDVVVRMYKRSLSSNGAVHYTPNFIKLRKHLEHGNLFSGGAPWVQMLEKAYAINCAQEDRDESSGTAIKETKGKNGRIYFEEVQDVYAEGGHGASAIAALTGKNRYNSRENALDQVHNATLDKIKGLLKPIMDMLDSERKNENGEKDPYNDVFKAFCTEVIYWLQDMVNTRKTKLEEMEDKRKRFVQVTFDAKARDYWEKVEAHPASDGDGAARQALRLALMEQVKDSIDSLNLTAPTRAEQRQNERESQKLQDALSFISEAIGQGGAVMFGQGSHYFTILDMKQNSDGQTFFLVRDPFNIEGHEYEKKSGTEGRNREEVSEKERGYMGHVVTNWMFGSHSIKLSSDWDKVREKQFLGLTWWDLDTVLDNTEGQVMHQVFPDTGEVMKKLSITPVPEAEPEANTEPGSNVEPEANTEPGANAEPEANVESGANRQAEGTSRQRREKALEKARRQRETNRKKDEAFQNAVTAREIAKAGALMENQKGLTFEERIEAVKHEKGFSQDEKIRQAGMIIMEEVKRVRGKSDFIKKMKGVQESCAEAVKRYAYAENRKMKLALFLKLRYEASEPYANFALLETRKVKMVKAADRESFRLPSIDAVQLTREESNEINRLCDEQVQIAIRSPEQMGEVTNARDNKNRPMEPEELSRMSAELMELEANMDRLYGEAQKWKRELRKMTYTNNRKNAAVVRSVLGRIRKLGAEEKEKMSAHLRPSEDPVNAPTKGMDKVVASAYEMYPREWVEASMNFGTMNVGKISRGHYVQETQEMRISGGSRDASFRTAVHELGHRMEHVISKILDQEEAFYTRRTGKEKLRWLGKPFDEDEVTRFDEFLNGYMGKDYGKSAYELVSMGFEMAFCDPEHLMQDPDMASWIYGMLGIL